MVHEVEKKKTITSISVEKLFKIFIESYYCRNAYTQQVFFFSDCKFFCSVHD